MAISLEEWAETRGHRGDTIRGGDDGFEMPEEDEEFEAIWQRYFAITGRDANIRRDDPAEFNRMFEWLESED